MNKRWWYYGWFDPMKEDITFAIKRIKTKTIHNIERTNDEGRGDISSLKEIIIDGESYLYDELNSLVYTQETPEMNTLYEKKEKVSKCVNHLDNLMEDLQRDTNPPDDILDKILKL